jgi:hypothetical protein
MRRYAAADEERILLQRQVRDWSRAGLLSTGQGTRLESELKVTLRRTGRMLRIGLALFTFIVVTAATGLIALLLDLNTRVSTAMLFLVAGGGCAIGAERLVINYRLYRHGVEEALAVSGVAFVSIGFGLLMSASGLSDAAAISLTLSLGAAGGFEVYRRFGFRYAAVAAMACVACIPYQLRLPAPVGSVLAAVSLAGIFAAVRRLRRAHQDDLTGYEARTLEAVAILGTYLVLNLQVSGMFAGMGGNATLVPWFKWTTYVLIWALPPLIVWLGVRERERLLIDAGIVTLLLTLMTNKRYLGIAVNPWDPILLGVVAAGGTILIRRWIAAGPGEERGGFTSARVSAREGDVIAAMGTVSTAFHPGPAAQPDMDRQPEFEGGRSGGAGGGAEF